MKQMVHHESETCIFDYFDALSRKHSARSNIHSLILPQVIRSEREDIVNDVA
jgi:hypothetical protein